MAGARLCHSPPEAVDRLALRLPVLAIVGGRDRMVDSAGTKRRLEMSVPQADVRLLPDAGHVLLGQSAVVHAFLRNR